MDIEKDPAGVTFGDKTLSSFDGDVAEGARASELVSTPEKTEVKIDTTLTGRHSVAPVMTTPLSTAEGTPGSSPNKSSNGKRSSNKRTSADLLMETVLEENEQESNAINFETKHQFPDGSHYTGQMRIIYKNKKRTMIQHGNGQFTLPDGRMYEGKWKNGKIAEGTLKYTNGNVFNGEFHNLEPHGYGEMQQNGGVKISGMWEDGDIHEGTEIALNGEVYKGQFMNL